MMLFEATMFYLFKGHQAMWLCGAFLLLNSGGVRWWTDRVLSESGSEFSGPLISWSVLVHLLVPIPLVCSQPPYRWELFHGTVRV